MGEYKGGSECLAAHRLLGIDSSWARVTLSELQYHFNLNFVLNSLCSSFNTFGVLLIGFKSTYLDNL